jgi:hypothetical protein
MRRPLPQILHTFSQHNVKYRAIWPSARITVVTEFILYCFVQQDRGMWYPNEETRPAFGFRINPSKTETDMNCI